MPRDLAGNYQLPAGNPVTPGSIITSSWANSTMDDIAQALTDSLDRFGRGGMLAPFQFTDGTKLTPGAAWINEPTTGLYREGGGDLRMAVLTQDVMRWQTTGVQIWNNTDMQWEQVVTGGNTGTQVPVNIGTVQGQTLYWDETTDNEWKASDVLWIDQTERRVGINAATPATIFTTAGSFADEATITWRMVNTAAIATIDELIGKIEWYQSDTGNEGVACSIQNKFSNISGGGYMAFHTGLDVEAMRIIDTGNVGIGTDTPEARLTATQSVGTYSTPMLSVGAGDPRKRVTVGVETTDDVGFIALEDGYGISPLAFRVNTLERMRIDSTGNVGIGTANPDKKLSVHRGTETAADPILELRVANAGFNSVSQGIQMWESNVAAPISINFLTGAATTNSGMTFNTSLSNIESEAMRIDPAGNVGIGATPLSPLHIKSTAANNQLRLESTSSGASIEFYTAGPLQRGRILSTSDDSMIFYNGGVPTERMRIDTAGSVLVGRTAVRAAGTTFSVDSPAIAGEFYRQTATGAAGITQYRSDVGGVDTLVAAIRADGTFALPSDATLKENFAPSERGLADLLGISVQSYDWTGSGNHVKAGFVAQDLQAHLPEAVAPMESGKLGVSDHPIIPVLVKAIQELTARLEVLENG